MIHRRCLWILATCAFPLCGCSCSYHLDVSGVVSSEDDKPLAGVKIAIDHIGDGSGQWDEFASGPDGTFFHDVRISSYEFDNDRLPIRVLWFKKEGYVTERADISPKQKPDSYKEHIKTRVKVRLKKIEPQP